MKRVFTFLLLLVVLPPAFSQPWTWLGGGISSTIQPIYGTKGIGSVNNYPGARKGGASWFHNGSFYMFGGDFKNDVWRYDTLSKEWTWESGDNGLSAYGVYGTKGEASSLNKPGGRKPFQVG